MNRVQVTGFNSRVGSGYSKTLPKPNQLPFLDGYDKKKHLCLTKNDVVLCMIIVLFAFVKRV